MTAKAFLSLAGTPMVVYALRTLTQLRDLTPVVVVVSADQAAHAAAVVSQYGPWPLPLKLAHGGAERQDSVAAGLDAIDPETDLVLVHDAARPFVSLRCVQSCIDAAATHGAAIVAVAAQDTVKLVDADSVIVETPDRRRIWLAQTPQVFRGALLREAHEHARRDGFVGTDDASLVERLGHPVRVVPGESTNRKITTPDDLQWAEWYLRTRREPATDPGRS